MISVLIHTKNEQLDLPGCLESLSFTDDIHIYDSGSTDNTILIANKYGAKITIRTYGDNKLPFGGDESAHRNWGLNNIIFKYSWVFVIDADERMTPKLISSALAAVKSDNNFVAYQVQRRDFFLGKWLKHVQTTPYYIRLIRPNKVRHERIINTNMLTEGPVQRIEGYLDHFPFSKGLSHWIERHNFYSSFEAQQILKNRPEKNKFNLLKVFLSHDFHEKRFHQKELFYRLPFRPLIKFFILYIFKLGFLDGKAGFIYALLQSIYEYFIVLKTKELEINN